MDAPTDDDLLLDLIATVTSDVLTRIGDDQEARFRFLKRLVALARETVRKAETGRAPLTSEESHDCVKPLLA